MEPVSRSSISASLAVATEEEQRAEMQRLQAKGRVGALVENAWNYVVDKVNTLALLRFDVRTISGWYSNQDPFLFTVRIAGHVFRYSKNPQVMDAILRHHRDAGPFSMATNNGLTTTFQEYFPGSAIQKEDVIMLCGPDSTTVYRNFLHTFFTPQHLQEAQAPIEKLITDTIALWGREQGAFNLSEATRQYACGIIAKVFLGHNDSNFDVLCRAIKTTILRIADNVLKRNNVTQDAFKMSRDVLRSAIDFTLQSKNQGRETIVQAMRKANFSNAQIYSMIFVLFLAGQDTSSSSIAYTLLKCAQDPKLQEWIREDIAQKQREGLPYRQAIARSDVLQRVIAESLRMMPPVSGISRDVGQDSVLKVTDEHRTRRYYIHAGERVTVVQAYLARDEAIAGKNANSFDPISRYNNGPDRNSLINLPWMPFGRHGHRCPGWALFEREAKWFIADLLRDYQLSTSFVGEPEQYTAFTNGLKHDAFIRMSPRT